MSWRDRTVWGAFEKERWRWNYARGCWVNVDSRMMAVIRPDGKMTLMFPWD